MHTEIPVLKRCCVCIPLRYGLLIWGYLTLIISLLLATYLTVMVVEALIIRYIHHPFMFFDLLVLIYLLELWIEVVFSIVLIVAAHKKNEKMLKVYYYYAIVFAITLVMTSLATLAVSWTYTMRYMDHFNEEYKSKVVLYMIEEGAPAFVIILLKCYVVFLVRSEILKLSRSHTFRFVNNAAESECKMNDAIYCNGEPEVSELNINEA